MSFDAVAFRRALHRVPELSGAETSTAARVGEALASLAPDELVTGLGGAGVAAVFAGPAPGPTVLVRCELDALPIHERGDVAHRSTRPGCAHVCGHDGHMAIVTELAARLSADRPARGRVVLLYQPAEETGAGAKAVVADPAWAPLRPDVAYALHNVPGEPLGRVLVRAGPAHCASRGLSIALRGRTSHASQPELGRSPAAAMCALIDAASAWRGDGHETAFVTVVGASLGSHAFGTSPGDARVSLTLRSETDATMAAMVRELTARAADLARAHGLELSVDEHDVFDAVVNTPDAVERLASVVPPERLARLDHVVRWSEDFGVFIADAGRGALFGLGAGEHQPDLHAPHYDFPDALIPIGATLFEDLVRAELG